MIYVIKYEAVEVLYMNRYKWMGVDDDPIEVVKDYQLLTYQ